MTGVKISLKDIRKQNKFVSWVNRSLNMEEYFNNNKAANYVIEGIQNGRKKKPHFKPTFMKSWHDRLDNEKRMMRTDNSRKQFLTLATKSINL